MSAGPHPPRPDDAAGARTALDPAAGPPDAPARLSKLQRLYRGFEALYQTDTGLDPHAVVLPYAGSDRQREVLLLREADDGVLEVALALDRQLLRRLESNELEHALGDEGLGHTLPVLEGLSHLVYLAEAARQERPVSGLELETQAEVDKLAICVLHRWPVHPDEFGRLVDRLYYRFELAPMTPALRDRYHTANRLALAFSRRLRAHVESCDLAEFRATLRRFWNAPMATKHALADTR